MSITADRSARTPLLLLFPAAGVAGFGLGMLGLSATLPAPVAAPIPAPQAVIEAPVQADVETAADPVWPALFGVPTPEPVVEAPPPEPEPVPEPEPLPEPEPEPEPEIDEPPFLDMEMFVLRGLVYAQEGSLAMLETEDGLLVVRAGDILPSGEEVTEIEEDGIVLTAFGEDYFIGFDDDTDDFDTLDDGIMPMPNDARDVGRLDGRSGAARFGLGGIGGDSGR